jgi:hypothetical protein
MLRQEGRPIMRCRYAFTLSCSSAQSQPCTVPHRLVGNSLFNHSLFNLTGWIRNFSRWQPSKAVTGRRHQYGGANEVD